jgi:AcrR family transcriptional regulator
LDDVADEAGLQRPNLYRYFANREALIGAVIVREIEITNATRRERISLRGPVGPILVESLVAGHEIARSDEMTQLLLVAEMKDTTSAIATAEQTILSAESAYWEPVLAYGRSRNEINAAMSDIRIVRWFLSMQVLLSTRDETLTALAADTRGFFADFVVPPVLNLVRG